MEEQENLAFWSVKGQKGITDAFYGCQKNKNLGSVIYSHLQGNEFWPSYIISLRDIKATLGLLPSPRHVIWRELVGLGSMLEFLKQSERVFSLLQVFLLLRRPGEPR